MHILYSVIFSENRAVCEIMWKNVVERGKPQMKIWHMCIVCWTPKATNTYSEYIIVITFSLQQWLHVSGSMFPVIYSVRLDPIPI